MAQERLYNHEKWIKQLLQNRPYPLEIDMDEAEVLFPLLQDHKLEGFSYSYWKDHLKENYKELCENAWKLQTQRNILFLQEWKILKQICFNHDIPIAPLKGIYLLGNIYAEDLGQRALSDIDVFVDAEHAEKFLEILKKNGFEIDNYGSWNATDFKFTAHKSNEWGTYTLEVHHKLFYTESKHFRWPLEFNEKTKNYELKKEHCFVHLCGHYVQQHTFLKLFWLIDILLFLDEYQTEMDFKLVMELAKKHRIIKSLKSSLYIGAHLLDILTLRKLWKDLNLKKEYWMNHIDTPFLLYPRKSSINYYIAKHITKDKMIDALAYDFGWFKGRAQSK